MSAKQPPIQFRSNTDLVSRAILKWRIVTRTERHSDAICTPVITDRKATTRNIYDSHCMSMVADIDIRRIIDGKTYTNLTKNTPT